jgi:hypothetical protein
MVKLAGQGTIPKARFQREKSRPHAAAGMMIANLFDQ